MIEKIVREMSKGFGSEQGRSMYEKYKELRKQEGWKVHQGLIIQVANELSQYLLSKEFTYLDKEEKDARQRAIYISKEIIDFLLDPVAGLDRHNAINIHNKRMEATVKGATRR
jgi:hypothetical protein